MSDLIDLYQHRVGVRLGHGATAQVLQFALLKLDLWRVKQTNGIEEDAVDVAVRVDSKFMSYLLGGRMAAERN